MKMSDFMKGLEILRDHFVEKDGYKIGAEHDIFYVYATDVPLTPEHVQKMHDLGWIQEHGDEYDPGEGWVAYV
jgi:hypothetical protein